jgi:hypothetical protein
MAVNAIHHMSLTAHRRLRVGGNILCCHSVAAYRSGPRNCLLRAICGDILNPTKMRTMNSTQMPRRVLASEMDEHKRVLRGVTSIVIKSSRNYELVTEV